MFCFRNLFIAASCLWLAACTSAPPLSELDADHPAHPRAAEAAAWQPTETLAEPLAPAVTDEARPADHGDHGEHSGHAGHGHHAADH